MNDELNEAIAGTKEYIEDAENIGICLFHTQTVLEAAQKYAKLKPLLDELVEARELASSDEWEFIEEAGARGVLVVVCKLSRKTIAKVFKTGVREHNNEDVNNFKFTTKAANTVPKIKEIMEGE